MIPAPLHRLARAIGAVVALVSAAPAARSATATLDARHREFFGAYCRECHGPEKQKGNLRLDTLGLDLAADVKTAETWQHVLNALNAGEMPPEDAKQPPAEAKTNLLEALTQALVAARRQLGDQGGTPILRRLNRREYVNTMRDLLGVSLEEKDVPADGGGQGFDTTGASLFFSSDQLERYLQLARKALDVTLVAPGDRRKIFRLHRECEEAGTADALRWRKFWIEGKAAADEFLRTGKVQQNPLVEVERRARFFLAGYRDQIPVAEIYLGLPEHATGALLTAHTIHTLDVTTIPADTAPGTYRVRLRAGRRDEAPRARRFIEVCTTRKPTSARGARDVDEVLRCLEVNGTVSRPEVIEFTLPAGGRELHLGLRERQPLNPDAPVEFHKQVVAATGKPFSIALWLDWIEIEGPIEHEAWPPASHRRVFLVSDLPAESDAYARLVVGDFARRAFRGKSVEPAFLDTLMDIHRAQRAAGADFLTATKEALAIVLASPEFLYLSEDAAPSAADSPRGAPVSEIELASRLSYFLWSASPDERLLTLAREGRLRSALDAETRRLLAAPRAAEFVRGFVHQWLTLDRLNFFQFDFRRYRDFDESVKDAARQEVFEFFATVLREDLSAGNFLSSDFTVLNPLLAGYYGIAGVEGPGWRKVALPAGSIRGGLLGMAAILAMGSNGENTSPVERGAWVLRKLLHDPPPPAPANIPQLSRLNDRPLTTRQRVLVHQEQPQCLHCHRKIDPIGFGLENFDSVGRWRTTDVLVAVDAAAGHSRAQSVPIDPSGRLHHGPAFRDYFELRGIVAGRVDDFSRGLIENLLHYALGRPVGFVDQPVIDELLAGMKADDHRLGSLVRALVAHRVFQTK